MEDFYPRITLQIVLRCVINRDVNRRNNQEGFFFERAHMSHGGGAGVRSDRRLFRPPPPALSQHYPGEGAGPPVETLLITPSLCWFRWSGRGPRVSPAFLPSRPSRRPSMGVTAQSLLPRPSSPTVTPALPTPRTQKSPNKKPPTLQENPSKGLLHRMSNT